jgi:hypothetical protein
MTHESIKRLGMARSGSPDPGPDGNLTILAGRLLVPPRQRLLGATGLALFLLLGVVLLPLGVTRAAFSANVDIGRSEAVVFTTVLPTFTPTPTISPTLTATETPTPTETIAPSVTPAPTDTPRPTVTPAPTEEPPSTDTPAATAAATAASTAASTDAPTVTSVPPPTASPTPAAPLGWLPLPPEARTLLSERWPLVAGGCLALVLVVLVVLLLLITLRRRQPKPPPPHPDAASGAYLESVDVAGSARRFSLRPEGISVGRAPDNDVVITPDLAGWDTVSRRHARIYRRAGQWVVDDLDSANGVWVNDSRTGHNLLRDGWRLRIGEVEFVFRVETGEAA